MCDLCFVLHRFVSVVVLQRKDFTSCVEAFGALVAGIVRVALPFSHYSSSLAPPPHPLFWPDTLDLVLHGLAFVGCPLCPRLLATIGERGVVRSVTRFSVLVQAQQ